MEMGTQICLSEENGKHLRNVSYPFRQGESRTTCSFLMDDSKPMPRDNGSTADELVKEITTLECEIVHLEQHLLSLYRTVFNQCLADSPATTPRMKFDMNFYNERHLKDGRRSMDYPKRSLDLRCCSANDTFYASKKDQLSGSDYCVKIASDEHTFNKNSHTHIRAISDITHFTEECLKKEKRVACNRTLADLLCASMRESLIETPCKLSEDIIKCISSVYHKLNAARTSQTISSSPISSISSASTFSLQDKSDCWSPRFVDDNTESPLKKTYDSFPPMLEISRISIDKDRFKSAAALLEAHRNLIRRLEKIDPSKFGHEEKLAFWLNIHNAMVMHAFIAYGLENNHIKNTPFVLKKSYNIGGLNFNAFEIQSSIFGCSPHRKNSRSIFSSTTKISAVAKKHPYALERPEPLVYFALSMGAYSDPPVRAYNAKNVIKQLELAKNEFINVNVSVHRKGRIMLPKILEHYAKDASLDLPSLIQVVIDCLPKDQQQSLQECLKGKMDRRTEWSPYRTTFRYMLDKDLDMCK